MMDLSCREILERTGWQRTVGGHNPYLSLYARNGKRKAEVESEVGELEIFELPSARGCTYVIPRSQFALALTCSQGFADAATLRTAKNYLGVTDQEIETLGDAVVDALKDGPLDPAALKKKLGDKVRNLGEEGKKRGATTTLPMTLGILQTTGRIRRVPYDNRLDLQRFQYSLWEEPPLQGSPFSTQNEAFAQLADLYFRWSGPATIAHFQWFSGLGVAASKEAVKGMGLVPLEGSDGYFLHPGRATAWNEFQTPAEPEITFVGNLDSVALLRRDILTMIDPSQSQIQQFVSSKSTALGSSKDFGHHLILDRGKLIGFWEFDPGHHEVVWATFEPAHPLVKDRAEQVRTLISEDHGDFMSFSLDSPASRQKAIDFLRAFPR